MVEGFYCMAESISFLFHAPMSIAYLLWLISFYHSSFYVNKDFLLSVIWFNAYLVPPIWVKKYYKWGWGSGVGGGGREERDFIVTFHVVKTWNPKGDRNRKKRASEILDLYLIS